MWCGERNGGMPMVYLNDLTTPSDETIGYFLVITMSHNYMGWWMGPWGIFPNLKRGHPFAHVMTLGLEQVDHMASQSGNVQ